VYWNLVKRPQDERQAACFLWCGNWVSCYLVDFHASKCLATYLLTIRSCWSLTSGSRITLAPFWTWIWRVLCVGTKSDILSNKGVKWILYCCQHVSRPLLYRWCYNRAGVLECSMHAGLTWAVSRLPYRKAHAIPRTLVHNRSIVDVWRDCQSHHPYAKLN